MFVRPHAASPGPTVSNRAAALRPSSSLLAELESFFVLLDANSPPSAQPNAQAAVLLNVRHFQYARSFERACSFGSVMEGTWAQGYECLLDLAGRAALWLQQRGLDPGDEELLAFWTEAIGLAWWSELVARVHLLPAPYLTWQGGMILAAVGLSEQLRQREQAGERCSQDRWQGLVCALGPSAVRQIESVVIQQSYCGSLSLAGAVRRYSYLGPWPAVALAQRLAHDSRELGWCDGVLERVQLLPTTAPLSACLRAQMSRVWDEYEEMARRAWQVALAVRNLSR